MRALSTAVVILAAAALPITAGQARHDPAAHPGFDGIWNSSTVTPLERPAALRDKAFFTPEEAAAFERQAVARNEEAPAGQPSREAGTGTYNTFFREFGTKTVKTLRTSIVTDPPDGRIP